MANPSRDHWTAVENAVFNGLCAVVDTVPAEGLRSAVQQVPGLRSAILEHHENVFACATEAGSRQKERDWLTYLHVSYGQEIPALASVSWPPSLNAWKQFLVDGRLRVSSHER